MGQAILLDPPAIAFEPLGRCVGPEPVRGNDCQSVERGAHRLGDLFQAVENAQRAQYVRRVRPLPTTRSEVPPCSAGFEQRFQQQLFGPTPNQTRAEFREHREIEARVGQGQTERVLPIDARPHRLSCLPVREPFSELHHRDQRQPPRSFGRPPTPTEERGEACILVDRPKPSRMAI